MPAKIKSTQRRSIYSSKLDLLVKLIPMEKHSPEQTLCVLPWAQLHIDEKGEFFPCCITKHTPLLDTNHKIILYQNPDSLEKLRNSPTLLEIKKNMLNGIKPESCGRCWKAEDMNVSSYRQDVNKLYPLTINRILKNELTEKDFDYQWFDLRLGNMCNLKCRMCSPTSSKALTKDHFKVYKQKYSKDLDYDWYKNLERVTKLFEQGHAIDRLHLAGGEPLLIKEGFQLLEKLISNKQSSGIELSYNTNLTTIPENALPLWREFKRVTLIVSIDGTDRINNYIRYPSDWHTLLKNISRIEEEQRLNPNLYFNFHVTVMAYNALNLKNLIRFFEPFMEKNIYPRFDFVDGVKHFSIAHLPKKLKQTAITDLESILNARKNKSGDQEVEYQNSLRGIIQKLNGPQNMIYAAELIRVTNEYDSLRDQKLVTLVPEMESLMNNYLLNIVADVITHFKNIKYQLKNVLGI